MGYYVSTNESTVVIPAEALDEALSIFKALNEPSNDHLKTGGRFEKGGKTASWFSWMPEKFDHYTSAAEVIQDLGFDTETNPDGSLAVEFYDSKIGAEETFFRAIAHLIPAGQMIEWHGEDHETWRWVFDGETLHSIYPVITWPEV